MNRAGALLSELGELALHKALERRDRAAQALQIQVQEKTQQLALVEASLALCVDALDIALEEHPREAHKKESLAQLSAALVLHVDGPRLLAPVREHVVRKGLLVEDDQLA